MLKDLKSTFPLPNALLGINQTIYPKLVTRPASKTLKETSHPGITSPDIINGMYKLLPAMITIGLSFFSVLSCNNATSISDSRDIKLTPESAGVKANSVLFLEAPIPKDVYSQTGWQSSCGHIIGPSTYKVAYLAPDTPGTCSIEAKSRLEGSNTIVSTATINVIAESIDWHSRLSSTPTDNYSGSGIVVDSAGNTYITGSLSKISNENTTGYPDVYDVSLAKLDPFGEIAWIRQFGTASRDYSADIAIDSSGNSYVAGYSSMSAGQDPDDGFEGGFVAKYDANGEQQWFSQVGSRTEMSELWKMAIDQEGSIIVTGSTSYQKNEGWSYQTTGVISKLDKNGNRLWLKRLELEADDEYLFLGDLVTDSAGSIVVLGFISTSDGRDSFLAKFDTHGEEVWFHQLDMSISNEDEVGGLAITPDDSIILVGNNYKKTEDWTKSSGSSYVSKHRADGSEEWLRRYNRNVDLEANSVTVDNAGNITVTGNANWYLWLGDDEDDFDKRNHGTFLAQFDSSGDLRAFRQFFPSISTLGHTTDNHGNIYITSSVRGAVNPKTRTYLNDVYVFKVKP